MARPQKEGIDYFSLDVGFFDDKEKIKPILSKYGADGVTLLLYLYCEIYKNGYYLKVDDDYIDIISMDLRMNQKKIRQMLAYFIRRSLFDNKLFSTVTVLTSGGIQKRYVLAIKERVKKRGAPILVKREYWLIPEKEVPEVKIKVGNVSTFIKVIHFYDTPRKNEVIPRKNDGLSEEKSLKESKVKNIINIYISSPKLNNVFTSYITSREQKGEVLTEEQISLLIKNLYSLSSNDEELIELVETATRKGWKDFYPLKKQTVVAEKPKKSTNKFNNFESRNYDMSALEKQLIDCNGGES